MRPQVVAVHRRVERAGGHVDARDPGHGPGESFGQHHAARGDAEEDEIVGAAIGFEDLVGDAGQRPLEVGLLEHGAHSVADSLLRLTGRASRLSVGRSYQRRHRRPPKAGGGPWPGRELPPQHVGRAERDAPRPPDVRSIGHRAERTGPRSAFEATTRAAAMSTTFLITY